MNNDGIGKYTPKNPDPKFEGPSKVEIRNLPKTKKEEVKNLKELNSTNIELKGNGLISFNGKTYKLNLFQLSTGKKLDGGALSSDEKKEIAEMVIKILSEKSKGFLGLFSSPNKVKDLKNVVLTDKRFFRHATEGDTKVYSKGVGYNKTQKKLFKSIQSTFSSKFNQESVEGEKDLQKVFDKKLPTLPHPLDKRMKDKYTFTSFEKDEVKKFPSDKDSDEIDENLDEIDKDSDKKNKDLDKNSEIGIQLEHVPENIKRLCPDFIKKDFTIQKMADIILAGQHTGSHSILYNILPWICNPEELLKLLARTIENQNIPEHSIQNVQEFMLGWLEHRQQYNTKSTSFDSTLVSCIGICIKKMNKESCQIVLEKLKEMDIKFQYNDNSQILSMAKIPFKPSLLSPNNNNKLTSIHELLGDIKKSQPPHKNMKEAIQLFAEEINNINLCSFSHVGLNEFNASESNESNLKKFESLSNKITNFLQMEILSCSTPVEVINLTKFFLDLGNMLKDEYHDYEGFSQIYKALSNDKFIDLIQLATGNESLTKQIIAWHNSYFTLKDLQINSIYQKDRSVPCLAQYTPIFLNISHEIKTVGVNENSLQNGLKALDELKEIKDNLDGLPNPTLGSNLLDLVNKHKIEENVEIIQKAASLKSKIEIKLKSDLEAKESFFPDIKPPEEGNFFVKAVNDLVNKIKGTSDKYKNYTKDTFAQEVIHDLGKSIDKDIDKLGSFLSSPKEELSPDEILNVIEACAEKFLELRQQCALQPNSSDLLKLYEKKHALFMEKIGPLDKILAKIEEKDPNKELKDKLIKIMNAIKIENKILIEKDPQLEGKEDTDKNNEIIFEKEDPPIIESQVAPQLPFEKVYSSIDTLLSGASQPGWKMGIVDGQMKRVEREVGVSTRKATSNTAKLIVENLLNRIGKLAEMAGNESQKNNVRYLLRHFYVEGSWVNDVINNFPILKEQIKVIHTKVPHVMENNFTVENLIKGILDPDKETVEKFTTLFDGLPWIDNKDFGNEAMHLISGLENNVMLQSVPYNQEKLRNIAEFIVSWMNHHDKYYAPDKVYFEAFTKVLLQICEKMDSDNNIHLVGELKDHYDIEFQGLNNTGDLQIIAIKRLPQEKIVVKRPKDDEEDVQLDLGNIKADRISDKDREKIINFMAHDIKNMNVYYFSKLKLNEFVNTEWSKDSKRGPTEEKKALNIKAFTDHFNKMGNYVTDQILSCENAGEAKVMVKFFIAVANKLRDEGDFTGFMQVSSAIGGLNIFKVRKDVITSKDEIATSLKEWEKYSSKNWNLLRELTDKAIENKNKSVVPFLGMYMTDLTFANEIPKPEDGTIHNKKVNMLVGIENKIKKSLDLNDSHLSGLTFKSNLPSEIEKSTVTEKELDEKYIKLKLRHDQKIKEKK